MTFINDCKQISPGQLVQYSYICGEIEVKRLSEVNFGNFNELILHFA